MTEVLQTPIKSPNDKNLYRLIKLENGLKALLIQHESAEKQAALVMNIDVGGFDDPKEAQGLSHFLEHMAFMGSEKYPRENEYHEYVASHGGELNAWTGFRETGYYFTISEDALDGAVDRLSAVFIAPLMLEDAVEREIEAVNSEFKMRINSDGVRMAQLVYDYVKDNHQAKVFICGNSKTLQEGRSNSELYQLVHEHRRKFYVSNRITLAIESSKSLDDLQKMIENYFNGVQSGEARAEIPQDEYKKIFKQEFFDKIIYMKPKTNIRGLALTWTLPRNYLQYKSKPLNYLTYLLNNSYKGGLKNYLKDKLLVTSFDVQRDSGEFGDPPLFSSFRIGIEMTEYGSKRVGEILEAIYSYLLLIKETSMEKHREIFSQRQKLQEMNFRFQEASGSYNNTSQASKGIRMFDDIDLLRSPYVSLEFNEEIIKQFIDLLNEPDFNIMIIDYEAEVEYNKVEQFFGTEIAEVDMPKEYRRLWNERRINEELSLPPKNDFICSNFDIYADSEGVEKMEFPIKIFENEIAESWYKIDGEFKTPKVEIYVAITSPFTNASTFNFMLTQLYIKMAKKHLTEKFAAAGEAGLTYSVSNSKNKIILNFSGYNEKMELLVDAFLKDLKTVHNLFDEEYFKVLKDELENSNKRYIKMGYFMSGISNHLLDTKECHDFEEFEVLSQINFEHLEKFVEKCFKKLKIQILIQGNFLKDHALGVTKTILDNFEANPIEDESSIELLNYQLPEGTHTIRAKSFEKGDANSQTSVLYDVGARSSKLEANMRLFSNIINEPYFDILRTKEQLAYSLNSYQNDKDHSILLKLSIKHQEDKFSSKFIVDRLEKFMVEDVKEILQNLTDEKFEKIRDGIIRERLEPFTTLDNEASYNFNMIKEKSYIFDAYKKEAKAVELTTKQEIVNFYEETFLRNKNRKLILQVIGNVEEVEDKEESESIALELIDEKYNDDEVVVTDLKAFKDSLQTHPKYIKKYDE